MKIHHYKILTESSWNTETTPEDPRLRNTVHTVVEVLCVFNENEEHGHFKSLTMP